MFKLIVPISNTSGLGNLIVSIVIKSEVEHQKHQNWTEGQEVNIKNN